MNEKLSTLAKPEASRPEVFREEFGALAGRLRKVLVLDGALELGMTIALWSLLSLALDWSLEMPRAVRACALVILALLAVRVLFLAGRRLSQRLSLPALAVAVEQRNPLLEGQLLNALSFQEELREARAAGAGRLELTLLERAYRESERAVRKIRFADALDLRPFWLRAGAAAGSLAAVGLLCGLFPATAGRWVERDLFLSNVEWPRDTRLVLDREEPVWHCARGESVPLLGWAQGKVPGEVKVHLRSATASRQFSMIPGANGRLSFMFPEVIEPFDFHLRGGDGRTDARRVEVHERPRVLALSFTLTFPAYLARPPETLENVAGDVVIPAGTKVLLRARADCPLDRGWVSWDKGERGELPPRGAAGAEGAPDHEVEYALEPKQSGSLDLTVVDARWKLESRPPVRARFRVEPDASPKILLSLKQKARIVTPSASVPYRVEARDDHGFSRLGLETVLSAGVEAPRKELAAFEGLPERVGQIDRDEVLDLGAFDLEPGMRVTLTAEGADNDGISGPKTARSNSEVLTVVEVEEFREAMARARAAARRELEEALNREEKILREFRAAVASVDAPEGTEAAQAAGEGTGGAGGRGSKAKSAEGKPRAERQKTGDSKAEVVPAAAQTGKEEAAPAGETPEGAEGAQGGQAGGQAGKGGKSGKAGAKGAGKAAGDAEKGEKAAGDDEAGKKAEDAPSKDAAEGKDEPPGDPAGEQGRQGAATGKQGAAAGKKGQAGQGQQGQQGQSGQQGQQGQQGEQGQQGQQGQQGARQAAPSPPRSLDNLARDQADAGQRVKRAGEELRQVMDALDQNRMLSEAEKRRFEAEIDSPLDDLGEERFPRTASELNELSRPQASKETKARTERELEQIAEDLRGVLDRLTDTEDFSDVLQRLEGVIQLHRQVIHTTRERTVPPETVPPRKEASPEGVPPRPERRKKEL